MLIIEYWTLNIDLNQLLIENWIELIEIKWLNWNNWIKMIELIELIELIVLIVDYWLFNWIELNWIEFIDYWFEFIEYWLNWIEIHWFYWFEIQIDI